MIHYRYARKNTEYIEKQYQIIPESVGVHLHGGETMGELVETQAAAAGVTFHRERAGGTISFISEEGVGTTFQSSFGFYLRQRQKKGIIVKIIQCRIFRERRAKKRG